jgi:hypothetical protein
MAKGTKTLNSALQVDDSGNVFLNVLVSEPDDGDVDESEMVFWVDDSGVSPILKVKTLGGGTLYTGDVATLSS